MIITQITFPLTKTEFCAYEDKPYPFITEPKGGIVDGPGLIKKGADYFFNPSIATFENEDVRFTYEINNQTVYFDCRVYNPKANFHDPDPFINDDGFVEVKFTNDSKGASTYKWEFGDGNSSTQENPVHIYKDFAEKTANVRLIASKGGCPDEITKTINIPQIGEIEFDLKPREFCRYDETPHDDFTLKPEGGEVKGDGVKKVNGQYVFIPALVPENKEKVEHTYIAPNGQTATLEINVYDPVAKFNFEVIEFDPEKNTVKVQFFNQSTRAETFKWIFGDGATSELESPIHTYENFNKPEAVVTLEAWKEKCVNSTKQLVPIPRETGPGIRYFKPHLKELSKLEEDRIANTVFGAGNEVAGNTRMLLNKLDDDLAIKEKRKEILKGSRNDKIAEQFMSLFNLDVEIIGSITDPGRVKKQNYVYKYYALQLRALLSLIKDLKRDVIPGGPVVSLLENTIQQLTTFKRQRLTVDPRGTLSEWINEIKTEITAKPVLSEFLSAIVSVIK